MPKKLRPNLAQAALIVLAVLLAAGAVALYFAHPVYSTTAVIEVEKHKTGVGALDERPVTQTFTASENGFSSMEVMFSNYNKKVKSGTLTLTVTDAAGTVLGSAEFPAAEQKNNAFVALRFAPVAASKGQRYTLTATGSCTEQKGITLRMGPLGADAGKSVLTLADGTTDEANALYAKQEYTSVSHASAGPYSLLLCALVCALCAPLKGKEAAQDEKA